MRKFDYFWLLFHYFSLNLLSYIEIWRHVLQRATRSQNNPQWEAFLIRDKKKGLTANWTSRSGFRNPIFKRSEFEKFVVFIKGGRAQLKVWNWITDFFWARNVNKDATLWNSSRNLSPTKWRGCANDLIRLRCCRKLWSGKQTQFWNWAWIPRKLREFWKFQIIRLINKLVMDRSKDFLRVRVPSFWQFHLLAWNFESFLVG